MALLVQLFPRAGATVYDEDGAVVPITGWRYDITLSFYEELMRRGDLLVDDPLDGSGGVPGSVPPLVSVTASLVGLQVTELATTPGSGDGEVKACNGYASAGDGGAGLFSWNAGVSAGSDGYNKINSTGGQWERLKSENILEPEWFGAVGDGSTSDDAAFTAMFSSVNASRRVVLLCPGRRYRITTGITINHAGYRVVFDGQGAEIVMDKATTFGAFNLTSIGTFELRSTKLSSTKSSTSALDIAIYCASDSVSDVLVHDCEFDRVAMQINDGDSDYDDKAPMINSVAIHHNIFYGDGTGLLANDTSNLCDLRGIKSVAFEDNEVRTRGFTIIVKTSGSCTSVSLSRNRFNAEGNTWPVFSCFADTHRLVVQGNVGYLFGTWSNFVTEKNGDIGAGVTSEPRDVIVSDNVIVAEMGDYDFEMVGFFGSWGLSGATAGLKSPVKVSGNSCRGLGATRVFYRVRGFTFADVSGNTAINQTTGQYQASLEVSNCETAIVHDNYVDGTILCDGRSSHPGSTYYGNSPIDVSIQGNTIKNYGSNGAVFIYQCAALTRLLVSDNTCVASASYSPPWSLHFQAETGHPTAVAELICIGNKIAKGTGTLYFGIADALTTVGKYVFASNSWSPEQRSFTASDATPSINKYPVWLTANASATVITAFDDTERNDTWLVQIGDANTSFDCTGTNLVNSAGAVDITAASGDVYRCTNYDGTKTLIEKMVARGAVEIVSEGSYTPALTADSGSPSLGNGAVVGRYRKAGNWVAAQVTLDVGSTTDLGASGTRVSIPFAASSALWQVGVAALYVAGTWYAVTASLIPGDSYVKFGYGASLVNDGSVPAAWGTGDKIIFSITYLAT